MNLLMMIGVYILGALTGGRLWDEAKKILKGKKNEAEKENSDE